MSVNPDVNGESPHSANSLPSEFPLRLGKIQRPLLPANTLRRDRLFDWLQARSDRRVLLVVAEAGFGKTTIVADYLRRSQSRSFWYRLDEEETDGLVFLRYMVAACRATDPRLLSRTSALLDEQSLEPTRAELVMESLLGELESLGNIPSVLVLDDFHVSESNPEIISITDRLISRAPHGLRVAVLARRTPSLAVGAARMRGDLAELGAEDLRFDLTETRRLFEPAGEPPLDPDILGGLQLRTDGWAASLQLVKAASQGRTTSWVRAFVNSLSGAHGDMYEFLAMEVFGRLPARLGDFLLRVAPVEELDADTAAVAASLASRESARMLVDTQRLGLVSRSAGSEAMWQLNPLLRDFLLDRIEHQLGKDGITELHRHLARAFEPQNWRIAARHWAAAGDAKEVQRVLCSAIPTVIGTGDFAAANDLIARFPDSNPNFLYDILRSRQLAKDGRYEEAADLVRQSLKIGEPDSGPDSSFAVSWALNALHLGIHLNDAEMSMAATATLARSGDTELASIAQSANLLWSSRSDGSLADLCDSLSRTAALNEQRRHPRHQGISLVNLSFAESARGHHRIAVEAGQRALRLLETSGNPADVSADHINISKALAHLGEWDQAQRHMAAGMNADGHWIEPETYAEVAELEAMYGDPERAMEILRSATPTGGGIASCSYIRLVSARVEMLKGSCDKALTLLRSTDSSAIAPGFGSAAQALGYQIHASSSHAAADLDASIVGQALEFTCNQQAWFWRTSIGVTRALHSAKEELNSTIRALDDAETGHLSIQAELVARRLSDLAAESLARVRAEAALRPQRWRWPLRRLLRAPDTSCADARIAAQILDEVGEKTDVALLRQLARRKNLRIPDAGRLLAKKTADRTYVEDLGRVTLRIGENIVIGTSIRKKVLALLTYLLTRPQFSASREQVIEALWPEMSPEAGANSLNQTTYFLRQVLEPKATEETTASLLESKGDLIWLDPNLVRSRSSECQGLVSAMRRDPSPELVMQLAESYSGRFAADFIYDDWASSFRDSLHASYLDRIERAIVADTDAGAFDRALAVAQLAMQADPDAEQIELCLLRLYRRMGAIAAAAEQYAHYSKVLRSQLGVEPPPLEAI